MDRGTWEGESGGGGGERSGEHDTKSLGDVKDVYRKDLGSAIVELEKDGIF